MGANQIVPHVGPQWDAAASPADILVFGGARGAGKSHLLLMECCRHLSNPKFSAVIFRRTYPQIMTAGGIWETSHELFSSHGGTPRESDMDWRFPSGALIQFRHLEHPRALQNWLGAQVPLICIDQAEQLSAEMFWQLLGANRSTCGVRPYVRLTCNPEPDSWLLELIGWWIDPDSGYPIKDRSGAVRWFARDQGSLVWASDRARLPTHVRPHAKSFTFIPGLLADNPTLEKQNPEYRATLEALPAVERERFLMGNWKIRPQAGLIFPRDKWRFLDVAPLGLKLIRAWDKAGTEGGSGARTAGVLLGKDSSGFYVVDGVADRWNDIDRENAIKATAEIDRQRFGALTTYVEQEPGSGGKDAALATIRNLAGFSVVADRPSGEKAVRWRPFASQVQAGNVTIVKDGWDWGEFVRELDQLAGDKQLDRGRLMDYADAVSLAFNRLHDWDGRSRDFWASGEDPVAERVPLSEEEMEDLPEFYREILSTHRGMMAERNDGLTNRNDDF